MKAFEYVILGAGSAGFAAAIRADELGVTTALVNGRLPPGGTCVNVGCVPSKTLLHIAQMHHLARRRGTPGLRLEGLSLDFPAAIGHELDLVEDLRRRKYEDVLASLEHVTYVEGQAHFVEPQVIAVGDEMVWGRRFLICTGSTARAPSIPGFADVAYLTHVEALRLSALPPSLLVIGGGPLALEFAQMYHHFGAQVTILQRSRVLREAEPEISRQVVRILTEEGIQIHESLQFLQVRESGGLKHIQVRLADGQQAEFVGQELLIGTGKEANSAQLGLEVPGVQTAGERRAVVVDGTMRTSASHVWAAGDVAQAPKRLETTAAKEGRLATDNALRDAGRSMAYDDVPSVIFTTPTIASVGPTDRQANLQGLDCRCVTVPIALVPKAAILGDTRGVIKMVIERESRRVVGVHMVSQHAEESIHEAVLAIKFRMTIDDIRDTVHVFPTMSEAIKLVATAFDKDVSKLSCCIE
jgi:mercuric reductase